MADPVVDRVSALVQPLLEAAGVDLYDLEYAGGVLRVVVQREGGVDLDAIAGLTRAVSRLLDETDPVGGTYTLEVSSPGLERRLRTPAHFAGAVGATVKLKLRPGATERRVTGVVVAADDDVVVVRSSAGADPVDLRVDYADIQQARTVFEWPGREKRAAS